MKVRNTIATVSVMLCALVGALLGGLLLSASPALAAAGPYEFSKSLEAPLSGSFDFPAGVAVGPAGEVFVVNSFSSLMDVYSSTGAFETEFPIEAAEGASYGVAVDDSAASPSKGDVYIGTFESKVLKYEYDGLTKTATQATSIATTQAEPSLVAVNSHGDVYVLELGKDSVNEYGPEGILIANKPIANKEAASIAVDNDPSSSAYENIFVGGETGPYLLEYEPSGACVGETGGVCPTFGGVTNSTIGLTVGPEGYVYVDHPYSTETQVYESSGSLYESVKYPEEFEYTTGIGVSGTNLFISREDENAVAEFTRGPEREYELKVEKKGPGAGEVTSSPPGIACGSKCSEKFSEGSTVTLTETPEPGSEFAGWTGCEAEPASKCEVTMGSSRTVEAIFNTMSKPKFELTVAKSSEGTVAGTGGIDCGPSAADCSAMLEEGASVDLTDTPEPGHKLDEWSEAPSPCKGTSTNPCTFTMPSANTTVAAVYGASAAESLTVYITGSGTVESSPLGLVCSGEECTGKFEGPVTLKGKPASGYVLAGWIGCKKTGTETCEVDVTAPREVTAVFLEKGEKGETGLNGTDGTNGANGANGANGSNGEPGANGEKGANGANGAAGAQGTAGPAGPAGPAGAAGKEGLAGKVQVVTCKTVKNMKGKKQQKCTTKTVSGTVKFTTSSARATLSRHGVVYAAGSARVGVHGSTSLRLLTVRKLRPGRYTLTLISGSGGHETVHRESFTLR